MQPDEPKDANDAKVANNEKTTTWVPLRL